MYENGWKGETTTTQERNIEETENYIASFGADYISVFNDCERYGTAFTRGLWLRWRKDYYVGKIEKVFVKTLDSKYLPPDTGLVYDGEGNMYSLYVKSDGSVGASRMD